MSNLVVAAVADTTVDTRPIPSAEAWFAGGQRVGYDPEARATLAAQDAPLKVFVSLEGDIAHAVTFLPGYPDGSFGWAKVRPHLPHSAEMPKLFFDYVGMGDSDKPEDYAYSTAERTDLVEAIWRNLSVQSTTLVAFDFSSLVVLEHLRRRLERLEQGKPVGGPDIRGVFIFNGGLFTDGHTHPWYTTPILRRLPRRARYIGTWRKPRTNRPTARKVVWPDQAGQITMLIVHVGCLGDVDPQSCRPLNVDAPAASSTHSTEACATPATATIRTVMSAATCVTKADRTLCRDRR
jgi:pimeloyl-ACP methyl ester carboxylesterase